MPLARRCLLPCCRPFALNAIDRMAVARFARRPRLHGACDGALSACQMCEYTPLETNTAFAIGPPRIFAAIAHLPQSQQEARLDVNLYGEYLTAVNSDASDAPLFLFDIRAFAGVISCWGTCFRRCFAVFCPGRPRRSPTPNRS